MKKPASVTWDLGRDRHGRRVTMTREGDDFSIRIEPFDQRDDGELIRTLSADLLVEAGEIAKGEPA
ncbi:MAG: hypothetical protein WD928_05060 [Gammaproteobacteria bacterium]